MGSITYIYIYIYIYIMTGTFLSFPSMPLWLSLSFFTIAHMFRWMVSWKIERDVMMPKRK